MYGDHFDFGSFEARHAELRHVEDRKLQVEVELLKRELSAARDRVIALETAYDDLQMAYEGAVRSRTGSEGGGLNRERDEALHRSENSERRTSSAVAVGNGYDSDADSDSEWEVYPNTWIDNTPASLAIPVPVGSIGSTAGPGSGKGRALPLPTSIVTPASTSASASSPSSSWASSPESSPESSSESEPETPALTNASYEDALRYAELLEQCDYNVKSANAVWREWEAAARERRQGEDEVEVGGLSGDSEEEEEENPDSDWEWEPYDYDAYERLEISPSSVSSLESVSYSSAESIQILSPARTSNFAAPTVSNSVIPPHVEQHPHHSLHLPLSQTHPFPSPVFRDIQGDIIPDVYVDASSTGVGFCFCVPTHSASATAAVGPRPNMSSMTCYWLAWTWVRGHPSIPLGVSGQIVMSWAELIALELGVHVLRAMKYARGDPASSSSSSASAAYPTSASPSSHTAVPIPIPNHGRRRSRHRQPPTQFLTIHSDNTGVVTALAPAHHTWTPRHGLDAVVRRILGTCREEGVRLDVRWVPTQRNVADGPSKGRGVRPCVGVGVGVGGNAGDGGVRAPGGGGFVDEQQLEREWEMARGWMEWIESAPVPAHLEAFVQRPTGGVVDLHRLSVAGSSDGWVRDRRGRKRLHPYSNVL